jgi:hypothetical protein
MSKTLDHAYQKARTLSASRQNEVGEILLSLVEQEDSDVRLSPAQEEEVRRRLANPGPLVPDHEMEAFFRKLTG